MPNQRLAEIAILAITAGAGERAIDELRNQLNRFDAAQASDKIKNNRSGIDATEATRRWIAGESLADISLSFGRKTTSAIEQRIKMLLWGCLTEEEFCARNDESKLTIRKLRPIAEELLNRHERGERRW